MSNASKRGRPGLSEEVAEHRRARWRHAMGFSGLAAAEAAAFIGRSQALVWSYGSAAGSAPTEAAIRKLEAYNLRRATEERDRLLGR